MRPRQHGLPLMGGRRLCAILSFLAIACVCMAFGMRASLTDYNADSGALAELPYEVSTATEGMLGLFGEEDVLAVVETLNQDGSDYTSEEVQDYGLMPLDNLEERADLVVTGIFTGERVYTYQAFLCEIEVTSVREGAGVRVGETLWVFDPFRIRDTDPLSGDGGWFSEERCVCATADNYTGGMAPLREGQEYLLFLEAKMYPEELDSASYTQTYCLAEHPYARIPTDATEAPERVKAINLDELEVQTFEWGEMAVMPQMSFAEACAYDVFVQGEDAKETYLSTCGVILDRVLGSAS